MACGRYRHGWPANRKENAECLAIKRPGKPDTGNPFVRFDEERSGSAKLTTTVCLTRLLLLRLLYAAAREGGCARGCKSHPSNWTVHDGTARCLSPRKAARGVSSPGIELMGLNEDEPQPMSLVMKNNRSRRVPGVRTKADAGSTDNRQPLPPPAGSAWQARRAGQPQIKRGERSQ
jgi:hypothetical protein